MPVADSSEIRIIRKSPPFDISRKVMSVIGHVLRQIGIYGKLYHFYLPTAEMVDCYIIIVENDIKVNIRGV